VLNHFSKTSGKPDIKACAGAIPITIPWLLSSVLPRQVRTIYSTETLKHLPIAMPRINRVLQVPEQAAPYIPFIFGSKNYAGLQFDESDCGVGALNEAKLTSAIAKFVIARVCCFRG
jgi:hypothetical protein